MADDNLIKGKNPEALIKPDKILKVILPRYFEETKNGKKKKLEYGKLKTAPKLIEALDMEKLCATFDDAQALIDKIKSYS